MQPYQLTVGGPEADVRGFTNVHAQCAVDRVALLGGGLVVLTAGVFEMADALHLRSGVTVRGQGAATILRKNPMKQAKVSTFLGFGHYDVVVDQPEVFAPGDGVILGDQNAHGFYQTTGTLVRRDGDAWFINRPFAHDYHIASQGWVKTLYPLVSAIDVDHAIVEDLVIEGNAAQNDNLNGCRGGGFFAHRANHLVARRLLVRDFKGEGFAFQTCDDLELDGCVAEQCTGNGFHPGSGSNRFHLHGCRASGCRNCGLFYCLRVRDSVLEDCVFENNGSHGVSINGRDTGHLNRRLTIRGNGGAGIWLCPGGDNLAAHGNVIEACTLEENCAATGEAEIVLQGETRDLRVVGNTIRRRAGKPGILVRRGVPACELRDNRITPAGADAVVDERPVVR